MNGVHIIACSVCESQLMPCLSRACANVQSAELLTHFGYRAVDAAKKAKTGRTARAPPRSRTRRPAGRGRSARSQNRVSASRDEGKDGGVEAKMGLRAQKQRVRDAKLHMIATRLRTSSVCVVYAA